MGLMILYRYNPRSHRVNIEQHCFLQPSWNPNAATKTIQMASFATIECLHVQVRDVLCLARVVQRLAFKSLHGSLDCTWPPFIPQPGL